MPSLFPNARSVPMNDALRGALRGATTIASAVLLCMAAGCGGGASAGAPATSAATSSATGTDVASTAGDPATTPTTTSVGGSSTPPGTATDSGAADADPTGGVTDTTIDPTTADTGAVAAATVVATGGGKTVVVGGTGTLAAGQTRVATLAAVPWSTLPAGSVVLVSAGAYAGVTTITAVGTKANPIVVTAADVAHSPVLSDSVDFQHAAWVTVSHVSVQAPTYAGFIIRLGSSHITVSDSMVSNAPSGVSITAEAGTGHQILRNTITGSAVDGIGLEVNADAAERTLVQRNNISRSGVHGIELRASHYQVEYNTVTASGQSSGGASGIHVYSGSASEDSGDDNLVRYNLSYANSDKVAADGNGIEIDQWCDGNTVAFNQAWGNDGAGIIVYDGSNNVVQNNTTWNDGVNSGGTHVGTAEIAITGTAASTARGNHVWNNLAFSTHATVPALYVDTHAVAGGNTIGANLLWNGAAGTVLRWTDSATKQTAAAIDATTGVAGSLVAAPAFADSAAPLAGGLKLAAMPSLHGVLPSGLADAAGVAPASGDAFFGAYYKAP